jgi:hypothetical protein
MKTRIRIAMSLALLSVGAAADAQQSAGALPDTGRVQVAWQDPERFSEVLLSPDRRRALEGDWVRQLALYVQRAADRRLPAGQRMQVTLEDVKRAGDRHMIRGNAIPIVRAVSPPSIRIRFVRTDTYGRVVTQGERTLEDPSVLDGPTRSTDSDPLVFEKRLVDGWLDRELPPRG